VRQLADRDDGDEDEADDEHDEHGLAALLGSGLDSEQVREHARNLPHSTAVSGQSAVDRFVARRGAGGRLERLRVSAQP